MFTTDKATAAISDLSEQSPSINAGLLADLREKCVRVTRLFATRTAYLDAGLLAQLGDQRARLASEIAELKEQAAECLLEDFRFHVDRNYASDNLIALNAANLCQPWAPELSYAPWPGSSCCGSLGFDRSAVPPGYPSVSVCCPACGRYRTALECGVAATVVFVAQLQLWETIAVAEEVLSIVIAAIVVFFHWHRITAVTRCKIAVSQRQFFTHHGAHPPAEHPLGSLGLFIGRGSQPATAA